MRTRTTWLSGVLVAFGLGMFTTGIARTDQDDR